MSDAADQLGRLKNAEFRDIHIIQWIYFRSIFLVLLIGGCGTMAPKVTMGEHRFVDGNPVLFVIAAKQKSEAVASLRRAGITVIDDIVEASHQLRITLGVDKSFRSCGTLNNVRYALRADGRPILEIQGRGWTGTCEPNFFDDMSQTLARTFRPRSVSGGTSIGGDDEP